MFGLITDVDRLPEWNGLIQLVVEGPTEMTAGAEWVVEMRALGSRWHSRARVEEIDPDRYRFAYRAQTDDGNPSFALRTWTLSPQAGETDVTVTWDLHPETFWRKMLLARIRHRSLREEVRTSIHEAERIVAPRAG
jgi:Polyketide cyclase / dehydrase and lipid transport